MPADIFAQLREGMQTMTGTGQAIARYIAEHGEEATHMSIGELAKKCDVVPSSVHRFCLSLGQSGFREFKLNLSDSLHGHGGYGLWGTSPSKPSDPISELLDRLMGGLEKCINDTRRLLESGSLNAVMRAMKRAERIALFGMGSSMITALYAYQRFMQATTKAICPQTYEAQMRIAGTLRPSDVAMLFPEERSIDYATGLAKRCSQSGAYVVSVAGITNTPLTALCDQCYPCDCQVESSAMKAAFRCVQSICIESICMAYEYSNLIMSE